MTKENTLDAHLKAFRAVLPLLLEKYHGKYAVGREGDEFTCWDTRCDAEQYGYMRYGINKPFIIMPVLSSDEIKPETFTRCWLRLY